MVNRWENNRNSDRFYLGETPKSLQMVTAVMKLKHLLLGRKAMNNLLLLLNHFSRVRLCVTSAHQAPPPLRFSRQEHWSGLPFPSPMNNLDSILKSRDITLQQRSIWSKLWFLVKYGCESWAIKKAEHQRIGTFELWS